MSGDVRFPFNLIAFPYEPDLPVYGISLTSSADTKYTRGKMCVAEFPVRLVTNNVDLDYPPELYGDVYTSVGGAFSAVANGLCFGKCMAIDDGMYTLNLVVGHNVVSSGRIRTWLRNFSKV